MWSVENYAGLMADSDFQMFAALDIDCMKVARTPYQTSYHKFSVATVRFAILSESDMLAPRVFTIIMLVNIECDQLTTVVCACTCSIPRASHFDNALIFS